MEGGRENLGVELVLNRHSTNLPVCNLLSPHFRGNWSSPLLSLLDFHSVNRLAPPLPLRLGFFGSAQSATNHRPVFQFLKFCCCCLSRGFVLSLWVNAYIFSPSLSFSEGWERTMAVRHIYSPSLTARSWTLPEILLIGRKHTQKHSAAYCVTSSKPFHLSGPQFPHI